MTAGYPLLIVATLLFTVVLGAFGIGLQIRRNRSRRARLDEWARAQGLRLSSARMLSRYFIPKDLRGQETLSALFYRVKAVGADGRMISGYVRVPMFDHGRIPAPPIRAVCGNPPGPEFAPGDGVRGRHERRDRPGCRRAGRDAGPAPGRPCLDGGGPLGPAESARREVPGRSARRRHSGPARRPRRRGHRGDTPPAGGLRRRIAVRRPGRGVGRTTRPAGRASLGGARPARRGGTDRAIPGPPRTLGRPQRDDRRGVARGPGPPDRGRARRLVAGATGARRGRARGESRDRRRPRGAGGRGRPDRVPPTPGVRPTTRPLGRLGARRPRTAGRRRPRGRRRLAVDRPGAPRRGRGGQGVDAPGKARGYAPGPPRPAEARPEPRDGDGRRGAGDKIVLASRATATAGAGLPRFSCHALAGITDVVGQDGMERRRPG